jgi:hypothetical protein
VERDLLDLPLIVLRLVLVFAAWAEIAVDRQFQPEKPRFVTLIEQCAPAIVEPAYFAAFATPIDSFHEDYTAWGYWYTPSKRRISEKSNLTQHS